MDNEFTLENFEKEFLKKRNVWFNKHFAGKEINDATYKALREAGIYLLKSQCHFLFLNYAFENFKNDKEFYKNLDSNNKEIIKYMNKFVTAIVEDINDILEAVSILFEDGE